MGNKKSNENAEEFFIGFGNGLANSIGSYINSPLGGIMLPIMIIGGLFVVSTVFKK